MPEIDKAVHAGVGGESASICHESRWLFDDAYDNVYVLRAVRTRTGVLRLNLDEREYIAFVKILFASVNIARS